VFTGAAQEQLGSWPMQSITGTEDILGAGALVYYNTVSSKT